MEIAVNNRNPTFLEVLAILKAFEQGGSSAKWTMFNIWVWPIFRTRLCLSYWNYYSRASIEGRTFPRPTVYSHIRQIFRLLMGTVLVALKRILGLGRPMESRILALDSGSRIQVSQNLWVDPHIDPILEWLDELGLEWTKVNHTERPSSFKKTEEIGPTVRLVESVASKLVRFGKNFKIYKDFVGYQTLITDLFELGVPPQCIPSPYYLAEYALTVVILSAYFWVRLTIGDYRGVLICCSYSKVPTALAVACRWRGLPCVEIQHGVAGGGHIAYESWHSIPATPVLPFPTAFLCWDEADKQLMRNWVPRIHLEAVGHPFTYFCLNMFNAATPEGKDFDEFLGDASFIVIATLGYESPDDASLQSMLRAYQMTSNWAKWIFRLHPLHRHQPTIDVVVRAGIEFRSIMFASQLPLPIVLQRCSAHVTAISSSALEASYFGVPTIMTNPEATHYEAFRECPLISIESDVGEIVRWLTETAERANLVKRGADFSQYNYRGALLRVFGV